MRFKLGPYRRFCPEFTPTPSSSRTQPAVILLNGHQPVPPAARRGDQTVLTAMDVEWTKNYRVRNGNIPFCYSLASITIPPSPADRPLAADHITVEFTSAYVEHADETQALIRRADTALDHALVRASYLAGHQLSSDLAILTNAATSPPPAVARARSACTGSGISLIDVPTGPDLDDRRQADGGTPRAQRRESASLHCRPRMISSRG